MSKAKDDPKDDTRTADQDPIKDATLDEAERDRINAERLEAKFHGYTPLQAERILKERDQPQPEVPADEDPARIEASEAEAKRKLEDPVAAQKEFAEQQAAPLPDPAQAAAEQEAALDKVDAKREEEAREHDKKRK